MKKYVTPDIQLQQLATTDVMTLSSGNVSNSATFNSSWVKPGYTPED